MSSSSDFVRVVLCVCVCVMAFFQRLSLSLCLALSHFRVWFRAVHGIQVSLPGFAIGTLEDGTNMPLGSGLKTHFLPA